MYYVEKIEKQRNYYHGENRLIYNLLKVGYIEILIGKKKERIPKKQKTKNKKGTKPTRIVDLLKKKIETKT